MSRRQRTRPPTAHTPAIRCLYEAIGPDRLYREHGHAYRNPHESKITAALSAAVVRWSPDLSAVLDLCCGSGEAALALEALGAAPVTGCDPFTFAAWQERTQRPCLRHDFAAIAAGQAFAQHHFAQQHFSLVVCSFALHLCAPSRLPAVVFALSRCATELWIVTPHKRPELQSEWGFRLADELLIERVRVRRYFTEVSPIG